VIFQLNPYQFNIGLYDVVFFGMLFSAFTLIVLLWFTKKGNRPANRFLALALTVAALWIVKLLAADMQLNTWLPLRFSLALGPLLYFYVRKLIRPEDAFCRRDLLHFCPVLLELVDSIFTYDATANRMLNVLAFLSVSIYLYRCLLLIENFYRAQKFDGTDRDRRQLRWLSRLLTSFGVLWLLWLPLTATDYFLYHDQLSAPVYNLLHSLLMLMMIWMAARVFLDVEPAKAFQSLLSVELKQKGSWLKRIVKEKQYYQDPELSLSSLAEKLGLHTHELSRIINTALKKSFNDFINEYRVKEAVCKMQDPAYDHITLLGIGLESGFNSQSTFYRIFKQMTGKSPVEYKNELKKEYSTYKLRSRGQFEPIILQRETTPDWFHKQSNRDHMFKSYFKIAVRGLMKNVLFSFINVFSLSIGLVCCMLIVLYIYDETSYDAYNKNVKRLYQVGTVFITGGKEQLQPEVPAIMAHNLKNDFPEVEQTARMLVFNFFGEYRNLVQYTEPDGTPRSFYEEKGCATDASFFKLFDYDFTEGNPASALTEPNSVVISEEMARKIFGDRPALHKVIRITEDFNGAHDFLVTGVFRPNRKPSHIDCNFFMSLYGGGIEKRMKSDGDNMAFDNLYTTYILLAPSTDAKKLQAKLPAFVERYAGQTLRQAGFYRRQFLVPVSDIHLHAGMAEMTPGGNVAYLYILASIAVFVLMIACINFMNLATARSAKRAVEVGVRKVLGAAKRSLVLQFLGESLLLSLTAFVVALAIAQLLMPVFEALSGKQFSLFSGQHILMPVLFFILSLLTGIAAGVYPAFYLSSFRPVKVLKGSFSNTLAALALRKGLVVLQFTVSVALIICALVISGQMNFLRTKDMGFTSDHQLVIPMTSDLARSVYPALKTEFERDRRVLSVGSSSYYPGISNPASDNYHREGAGVDAGPMIELNHVDESYLQTLGMRPVAGRLFSLAYKVSDKNKHIILNQIAVKSLGFSSDSDAVGKNICSFYKGKADTFKVIGVVKNFNFEDLHQPIQSYGFFTGSNDNHSYIIVHIGPGDAGPVIRSLNNAWRKLDPSEPFVYSFLDQDFQRNYISDTRLSSLVNYFTLIAIIVSCMGLFGLATFSAEQRSKEMSIRKVLGAGVARLVLLLAKDFLKLVVLAIAIAVPVAWLAMHQWLQGFTEHITISLWVFMLTAAVILVITLSTIIFQAMRAALANPVRYLKSE
jgi:putative ABC transport system permease protein